MMATMCIIDKDKDLESIIQVTPLGKNGGKGKIKTSKRRKIIRRATSGINDIKTETQQRKSAMEKQ
jgi:hypothetical protein